MLTQYKISIKTAILTSFFLLLSLSQLSYAVEKKSNPAPTYIQQVNQKLTEKVYYWLNDELKAQLTYSSTPQYKIQSIFIKNEHWQDRAQYPYVENKSPWYTNLLNHFKSTEKAEFSSANKTISRVTIDISFKTLGTSVYFPAKSSSNLENISTCTLLQKNIFHNLFQFDTKKTLG